MAKGKMIPARTESTHVSMMRFLLLLPYLFGCVQETRNSVALNGVALTKNNEGCFVNEKRMGQTG